MNAKGKDEAAFIQDGRRRIDTVCGLGRQAEAPQWMDDLACI